jgi:hypothetical protein
MGPWGGFITGLAENMEYVITHRAHDDCTAVHGGVRCRDPPAFGSLRRSMMNDRHCMKETNPATK